MEEEKALAKVAKPANIDESGDIKDAVKDRILNLAVETYTDVMLTANRAADRKAAADAVVDLLGKKKPQQSASAQFNFNIPPEYFKRVFGEGLPALTAPPEPKDSRAVDAPFTIVSSDEPA